MLTSLLVSNYRAYKEDTDNIATWLALTAKQYGIHVSYAETDCAKSSSRLKGKAWKLAREAAGAGVTDPKPKLSKYMLRVKDFTVLAEGIANSGPPPIDVPEAVSCALDRAIKLRQAHGAAYEWSTKTLSNTKSRVNLGHIHFIDILRKTRELLVPYSSAQQSNNDFEETFDENRAAETETAQDFAHHVDQKNNLDTEEKLKGLVNTLGSQQGVVQDAETRPRHTTEPVNDPTEQATAAMCLLMDMIKLREIVNQLWRIYQIKTGILPVAISVNTVIELVCDLQHDSQERFPDKLDYGHILDLFLGIQAFNGDQECSFTEAPYGCKIGLPTEAVGEKLMIHTYLCCRTISTSLTSIGFSVLTPETYEPRDRTATWANKSRKDKEADDNLVLHELIPDLSILSCRKGGIFGEDGLLRGWRELRHGQPVSLWFVFAMQCFLDAQYILEGKTTAAFSELQKFAAATKTSILRMLKIHDSVRSPVPKALKETGPQLRGLLRVI